MGEPLEEGADAAGEVADFAGEFAAVRGEEDEGGEAADVEASGELLVAYGFFSGEGAAAGEVEDEEDEVLVGVFLEFGGREDFFIEAFARGAPIGAGEFEEDGFVSVFSALEDLLKGFDLGGER